MKPQEKNEDNHTITSRGEADGKTFCSVFGAQEPVGFAVVFLYFTDH